jgi:hypothetical protein
MLTEMMNRAMEEEEDASAEPDDTTAWAQAIRRRAASTRTT